MLSGVQAILRLIEDDGAVDSKTSVGDFLAAMRRQAVHEDGVGLRRTIRASLTWKALKTLAICASASWPIDVQASV